MQEWRRKTYYRPRVLINTDDCLQNPYDSVLLCLTGGEINIIRNLLAYATRRATFVTEYQTDYYLAPTTAEWDALQAMVSELEDKLMNCNELMAVFEDILTAVQCTCTQLRNQLPASPVLTPIIDGYIDSGAMISEDTYGATVTVDGERCAVAQLVYANAWEFLTEVLQPTQKVLVETLTPVAMLLLFANIGQTILGIPAASLLASLYQLIQVWVAGSLESVQNQYISYKEELICAVYNGLATTYRDAEAAAVTVIEGMDELSPIDMILLHTLFAPWAIHLAQTAYDNATAWALANVEVDYCDDCDPLPLVLEIEEEWPPCPGAYWTDGGICYDGRLCWNGGTPEATQQVVVDLASIDNIECRVEFQSVFGSGWTVGHLVAESWDPTGEKWDLRKSLPLHTSVAAGNTNVVTSDDAIAPVVTDTLWRISIAGQPGQGETEPYPLECELARVTWDGT